MKTKQYIQPATQITQVQLHSIICFSIGGDGDGNDAQAPLRQFSGETKKITTLYI